MDWIAVGGQLRAARLKSGLTMRELAGRAGVSHQLIEKVESGRVTRLESLERIAAALGATLNVSVDTPLEGPPQVHEMKDRLAVAARLLAVLPRLPDRTVDVLLHEIALWEAEKSPQGEQR